MTAFRAPCYARMRQLREKGLSLRRISKIVKRSTETVRKWVTLRPIPKFYQPIKKKGRKTILTEAQEDRIAMFLLQHKYEGCKKLLPRLITKFKVNICERTIQRLAHKAKLRWGKPLIRPKLHSVHKAERVDWCEEHKHWTVGMWKRCIFCDEKIFRAGKGPRALRYKIGDRPIQGVSRYSKQIHVWWAIHATQEFPVIPITGNLNSESYQKVLAKAFRNRYKSDMIFVQDNARPHSAKATTDWLTKNGVNWVKDFPPYSPDLNPIENLWGIADYFFRLSELKSNSCIQNLVKRELLSVGRKHIVKLISSMPKRISKVIAAEGATIDY